MNRTIVFPEEFITKINDAYTNPIIQTKWNEFDIASAQDMINEVILSLNVNFPKLNIVDYRAEDKHKIKQEIGNKGSNSMFTGYLETGDGNIDGLFFYIPPSLDSGNDFLTRQVMPSLLGIYEGIATEMESMYFNNRPVYIVNINETSRSEQRAVKISFLCAELLGFNYIDIFNREYNDVLNNISLSNTNMKISLNDYGGLFEKNGVNELFEVDDQLKELKLLSGTITSSTNASAESYRYILKILPAIYMAIDKGYGVNINDFNNVNLSMFEIVRTYISKI